MKFEFFFPPDCPDEQWLARVGQSGWVAITHNARIRYMPNERDAVVRHSVALLVVVDKAPFNELAQNFVATAGRVIRNVGVAARNLTKS